MPNLTVSDVALALRSSTDGARPMLRCLPNSRYPGDPGEGVTLARDVDGMVRVGVYFDGAERLVLHLPIPDVEAVLRGPVDAEPTDDWQRPHEERIYG